MSDPRILGATTHKTLIGDKTWTTESDQGGQGQEQALDRQEGVQEFFFFRPHCCLFLCFCLFHISPLLIVCLTRATGHHLRRCSIHHPPHSTFCFCLYVYVMVFLFLFTRFNLLFGVAILIATLDCLLSDSIQTSLPSFRVLKM
jgi:hypothetical protein